MKQRVYVYTALVALLLAGVGCANRQATPQVTGLPQPPVPASNQKEPDSSTPSGAASAIINQVDMETGVYDEEDSDTADTKAGSKEVNDFIDTTYDVSQ